MSTFNFENGLEKGIAKYGSIQNSDKSMFTRKYRGYDVKVFKTMDGYFYSECGGMLSSNVKTPELAFNHMKEIIDKELKDLNG